MTHSELLNDLATALSAAQADFKAVDKDSVNPFFKSKYAGLPEVVKTASPIITKHGLSVMQTMGFDGENDTLTTMLLHNSGQWVSDTMRLHLSKEDAQGHGSATTYARRYSYMSILGLVAEEDDDGNSAVKTMKPVEKKIFPMPKKEAEPTEAVKISEVSKTKVRQAFHNAEMSGVEVTEYCQKVIGKNIPETEEDAQKLLVLLSTEGMN